MSKMMKRVTLALGAGALVAAVGLPPAHADETVIEKRVEESHSYKVEQPAPPAVIEQRPTVEAVPAAPAVVEKRTTVETVPAAPVIEKRTTETTHTDD